MTQGELPVPEPAPAAVVGSSARTDPNDTDGGLTFHSHKLPHRRFIGPIPDSYTSSAGHKVSDHWFSSFKGRVLRDGEEQMLNREGIWTTDHQPALRKLGALANSLPDHVRHPLRPHHTIGEVHRADDQSIVAESILTEATRRSEPPVASGSRQTARHPKAPAKKKKQKKRIERDWHGDSFDVGAEFFGVRPVETRCSKRYRGMIDIDEDFLTTSSSESDQEPNDDSRIRLPRRGTGVTTTTQQSFRTARTHQPGTTAPSLGSRRPSSATGNTQFYSAYSETPNEQMNDDFFAAPQIANSIANSPVTTATTRDGGNHSGGEDPYGSATNLHDLPPALGVSYDPGGVADSGFERTANEGPSTSLPEPQLKAKAIKNKSRPAYNSTLEGILKVARKYRQATGNEGPNGPGEYERTVLPADLNLDREPTRHSGKAVQFPADNAVTSHDDTATIKSAKHRRGILKNTGSWTMREDPKDQAEEQKASANRIKAYDDALDPEEVLARTGSEVAGTSAGVIEANKQRNQDDRVALSRNTTASTMLTSTTNGEKKNRKGKNVSAREAGLNPYAYHQNDNPECAPSASAVLLRDRMLVRVGRNREVGLDNYDEHMIGRKPCHRLERMQEYLVAYRKGRIELYQEWSAPWAGKWHTTKKLCFTIPLHPKYTKFSLFSSTDLSWSLCLNSEYLESRLKGEYGKKMAKYVKSRLEDTKQLSFLKAGAHNSQVFIFECRERQRAMDWMWEIWKELDGELPVNIDVHIPLLRNTIRLQRPSEDSTGSSKTCRALSRSQILKDCYKALRKGDDFERLAAELKRGQGEPPRMELAWHREGYLDWITRQNETTLDGEKRYWALLAGFAITSSRHAARLELRPARHSSSLLKLSDGTKLKEPPSIEGYLYWQMSTRSNLKENVYFFSYGGSLFYSLPKNVEPPVPSHHRPQSHGSQPDATAFEEYMAHEYARGTRNILRCLGFFDFRDIAHVRLKPIVRSGVMKALVGTDDQSESDVEEEREDGMTKKTRAIEVVMERTGRTVTLVAHSSDNAAEWVDRLQELHDYWSHKHRLDARERMDISRYSIGQLRSLTDEVMNADDVETTMPFQWNWCPIEKCSPVIHSGRLYVRESPAHQFRSFYVVLTEGHLVAFRLEQAERRKKQWSFSLLESYVYSGVLAAAELSSILQEDVFQGEARIFPDGLANADMGEDCMFAIWARKADTPRIDYRRYRRIWHYAARTDDAYVPPRLGRSCSKLLIFRARSKLERDLWVKVLQIEIQRQAFAHPERTRKARFTGMLLD